MADTRTDLRQHDGEFKDDREAEKMELIPEAALRNIRGGHHDLTCHHGASCEPKPLWPVFSDGSRIGP